MKFPQIHNLSSSILLKAVLLALFTYPLQHSTAGVTDLGVYKGPGRYDLIPTFETWFGRDIYRAVDFYDVSTWAKLQDNQWLLGSWKNKGYSVVFSIGMLPSDGSGTLANGAAGAYNTYWRTIAAKLISNGYGSATIRLGWEMNGGWYAWSANSNKTAWVNYWRVIVTEMRSVSGANFKFTWNPNNGYNQFPADQVYPGDAYVDHIGVDVYNQSWVSNYTNPQARWNDIYAGNYGVRYWAEFARNHNKPLVFPEWGTGARPDGHGGGDDPYFIEQMFNVIATTNSGYHNYWDFPAADYNSIFSNGANPLAGAKFKQLFGNTISTGIYPARTFETDILSAPSVSTGVTHGNVADNGFTYARGTSLAASATGQQVSYLLRNIPAGTYNVKVRVRKTNSAGRFQLSVGYANNFTQTAVNVGSAQDCFVSGSWTYPEIDLGNLNASAPGDRWFRFTSTGKNGASTGYQFAVDYIKLTPQ